MATQGDEDASREEYSSPEIQPAAEPDQAPASRGGRAVVEKYGAKHMAEIGRKGSRAVVKKYGLRFYSEIASRNKGVKKRPRAEADPAPEAPPPIITMNSDHGNG